MSLLGFVPRVLSLLMLVPVLLAIIQIGLVVDLTNSSKYYGPEEFEELRIQYVKVTEYPCMLRSMWFVVH